MKITTLCYLEKDDCYLMLYRNRKKDDENAGKWIGVGGKLEQGETVDECMKREVLEETGLYVGDYHFYGVVEFRSDRYEPEDMYLYSSKDFKGTMKEDCDEGELSWIRKDKVMELRLWEGDRYFLEKMVRGDEKIHMRLVYKGDDLENCVDLF